MGRLTWFEREALFSMHKARPRTVRACQVFGFEIDPIAIYTDILAPFAENPDDESFPSPVRRWYGQIDDRPFAVDVFHQVRPNECRLQIPYSDSHDFLWQSMFDLQVLPNSIRTKQPICISNDSESRALSVFRHDDLGFDYPIYDGVSDEDAQALFHYLREQSPNIQYSLALPDLDITWVAKEIVGDSRVHRARYNSRTSALRVGCEMSSHSNNEFIVYSESADVDHRRYTIFKGIVTALNNIA